MFADKSTSVKKSVWSSTTWLLKQKKIDKERIIGKQSRMDNFFCCWKNCIGLDFFYRCALMLKFMFGFRKAQINGKSVSKHLLILLGPLEFPIPLLILLLLAETWTLVRHKDLSTMSTGPGFSLGSLCRNMSMEKLVLDEEGHSVWFDSRDKVFLCLLKLL